MHLYGEDPSKETCLDRLIERRLEKEGAGKRLTDLRKEQTRLAPQGSKALSDDLADADRQRQIIYRRRPLLEDWQPTQEELEKLEKDHRTRAAELETARKQREILAKGTAGQQRAAEKQLGILSEQLAAEKATCKSAHEELQRLGDESALQNAVIQAEEEFGRQQKHWWRRS